eukprot:3179653-Amphidinium_carterae.1
MNGFSQDWGCTISIRLRGDANSVCVCECMTLHRRENVEGTLGKLRGQLRIIKQELAASSSHDIER